MKKLSGFTCLLALFLCAFIGISTSFAQQTVDFRLIKQKKIRKIIKINNLSRSENYTKVKSNCLCEEDSDFNVHKKSYLFQFPIKEVWNAYLEIPPKTAWSDNLTSFGMMYESHNGLFHYVDDVAPVTEVGQLIFINLHLLKGLVNIAVAHEVKEINEQTHLIRTCYLESGKSKGTQFLRMKAVNDHETIVEHTTFYKSGSRFRDKHLYPILHEKIISEFHANINHYLTVKSRQAKHQLAVN